MGKGYGYLFREGVRRMIEDNETHGNVTYMYGKTPHDQMEMFNEEGDLVIDDTVNIPIGEYEELLDDSTFLGCLERAGVDSWEGYGEALSLFEEENEAEEGVGG